MEPTIFDKIFVAFVITANLVVVSFAWAQSTQLSANLQESAQETVQKVKESVTDLDKFEETLNLLIIQAKWIKDKLNALENLDEKNSTFRDQLLEKFDGFLIFCEEQKKNLENSEKIDLIEIKEAAQSFRDWWETIYIPELKIAAGFLLINQQKIALEMTERRYKKISLDIKKLKEINFKGISKLEKLLGQAADSIKEAKGFEQEAEENFWLMTATSTATSTDILTEKQEQFLSIRNLIGKSLNKVKETYQIFIEMSNFVKKLLI